jgi:hypothetical protein
VPVNEVAAYESPAAQREVIAHLEKQPEVRYAVIPPPNDPFTIDGVPNSERAPLVWTYLQQHFRPVFEHGAVVVWKRVDLFAPSSAFGTFSPASRGRRALDW